MSDKLRQTTNPAAADGWDTGRRTAKITSGGELVFEGDVHMFRNCFFDNAEWGNVLRWAETEGFTIELLNAEEGQR